MGFGSEGLTYQLRDTTFQIEAVSGGIPFTYRYGDDLAYFRDASQTLMR